MEAVLLPLLTDWAATSHPGMLLKELIIFMVAFFLIKKWFLDKIINHMQKIETKFDGMITEINGVKTALVNLESNHTKEIDGVKQRLTILETKPTNKGE